MSWYSKPASRWWEESSEKKWHDRESSRSLAKAWNSEGHETWNGQSRGKDDWKALGEWAQSKTKTKGDFRASPGDWSGKVKDWKSEKIERIEKLQRHQWVAKSDKQLESDKPPSMDPAVALEGALADVGELLGERLDSTRELLEDSHRSAMEAVRLATLALELLTRKAVDCKNEEDLNNVMRAKQSVRELLMWRNFGLKTWLHNKPDPMNFQRYDAEVQNELRQTFTKIEQNLLQELVAGDSWSKLARKLRFCVGNQDFSREMRTLLTRIISSCELAQRARHRKSTNEAPMSEADQALFEEMAADAAFGKEVIRAVRNDQFRHQEVIYPYAEARDPAWMQQMLGWHVPHVPPANVQCGQLSQPLPVQAQRVMSQVQRMPWAEPWAEWKNFSSSAGHAL